MDGQLDQFVNELKRQLRQLDRRIRSLALLRGLGLILLVLISLVVLQISLDFILSLGTTARIAMSSLSVTILVACVWFVMLKRVFHKRTPVELAAIVEESQARLNERLTSVLELSATQNESSSVLMREQLAKETIASLTTFNITDSVPSDRTMRFVMSAGIAIMVFLTPLLIWPDAYRLLISRSVIPWGNFATVSSLYFEVQPGDDTISRGKDLQIIATPHWHTKQPGTVNDVWIEWEDSKGEQFSRRMDLDQETGEFKTQFSRLLTGFQYSITSDRSRSQLYTIQIAEPASITETLLTITPPAYTNSKQQELAVLPSEINVFEQSHLVFQLTFDRPVTSATLHHQLYQSGAAPEERPPVEQSNFVMSEDQLIAVLELPVHKNSFLFHLEFRSKKGDLLTKTSEHLVKVILDRAPEIELSLYNQPEFFKPDETLTIPVKVIDDFSVEELEIHVKKLDEKATIFKVPAEQLRTKKVDHEFKVDLQQLQAEQSDIFTYRIRTADNREVPSPNEVWSTPRVFGVDKNAEEQLSAGVISRQQELRDELRKIQQEYKTHREIVEQNIAQLKQATENDKLKPEDEQELLKSSLTERKLAQRLETVANEFLQLPLYQKLAEQAQEIARTDFVENHDQLKSAAESETKKQATKTLEPALSDMSATEEKLGDLARQYEKLVDLENDLLNLNQLAEETNNLADDMLAFNNKVEEAQQKPSTKQNGKNQPADKKMEQNPNASEKPDPHQKAMSPEMEQELAQLQAELKHRQSRLAKDLDNLLDRRPELVDAARNFQLKQLDSLVNQTSQLVEPQKQLAEAMQQQAPVSAGRPPTQEPQQPSEPNNANTPSTNNQAEEAPAAGQANSATPAANSQPAQNGQASETKMNPQQPQAKSESVRDLQNQQRALAEAAAQFALETAQQFGPESEPTRKATKLAEEAIKAQQESNAGRLHEASQAANRASQVAEDIMKAHQAQNKEQTERDAFLEQAEQMANLQQELAGKMEQASTSEAKRQEAVRNSQEDLAQQTEALSRQLAETSNKLESNPLELKKESQQAGQAQQKTENASQAMQKAVEGLSQKDLSQAAKQAQAAAKALQDAARQAQKMESRKQKESPVPEKVGNQVTDAARQLRDAQKQLEETPEFKAGNPQTVKDDQSTPRDSKPEPKQAQSTDQKPSDTSQQKGQAKAEGGDKGQSSQEQAARDSKSQSQEAQAGKSSKQSASKKAAESLKRAAESLSQAATQLKSRTQKGSDSGKGQQSKTAAKNPAPGKGQGESEGGGAKTNVDFSQLQTKLKAMSNRNWGELPGNLDTEILQGSRSRTDPEYARLIKHYFEAIAKSKPDSK